MHTDQSTVLVTGGTGSFGSTMIRRLLDTDVREVRVLSRDELKQHELRQALNDSRVRFYLGDVRDEDSVNRATRGVDFVFHAAALKQVPSCEFFPLEAVRTNILGSSNVIEASNANGVQSVVCLGTDKAAYPVNAMGMSKALMEKVAQAFARNNPTARTTVSTVRYGNVMMSRGSVIPLFLEQIGRGEPLTVTDPSMTRFLMSLDDAVHLVEHAFEHARPGDLFIRKAPASTVGDLARAVGEAMGCEPKLTVIGTRHGEKLYETLATREELARSEDQGDYFRVAVDARDLNYGEYFDEGDPRESELDDYHSHNTERLDVPEVVELLQGLPDFRRLVGTGS
ncbi:polysaccharide biosynthesis protein [Nocardioides sp. cx-173]|uniref:polysaccharide biosynthesis protein n=1 Tax=Nocardioides sp. cx-173 TaxID=2898796 RepID=UPI001E3B17CF|nr:polysaccharide biosynthesis protein [Nocardioides sp. cx-173]MCD4523759.1 polysaccharide biosynthesis protein [Nocardioides sp. cx-173]UGB41917.1 polysaccharide biosynthesis protein [Nocardioides sp. cx-173]